MFKHKKLFFSIIVPILALTPLISLSSCSKIVSPTITYGGTTKTNWAKDSQVYSSFKFNNFYASEFELVITANDMEGNPILDINNYFIVDGVQPAPTVDANKYTCKFLNGNKNFVTTITDNAEGLPANDFFNINYQVVSNKKNTIIFTKTVNIVKSDLIYITRSFNEAPDNYNEDDTTNPNCAAYYHPKFSIDEVKDSVDELDSASIAHEYLWTDPTLAEDEIQEKNEDIRSILTADLMFTWYKTYISLQAAIASQTSVLNLTIGIGSENKNFLNFTYNPFNRHIDFDLQLEAHLYVNGIDFQSLSVTSQSVNDFLLFGPISEKKIITDKYTNAVMYDIAPASPNSRQTLNVKFPSQISWLIKDCEVTSFLNEDRTLGTSVGTEKGCFREESYCFDNFYNPTNANDNILPDLIELPTIIGVNNGNFYSDSQFNTKDFFTVNFLNQAKWDEKDAEWNDPDGLPPFQYTAEGWDSNPWIQHWNHTILLDNGKYLGEDSDSLDNAVVRTPNGELVGIYPIFSLVQDNNGTHTPGTRGMLTDWNETNSTYNLKLYSNWCLNFSNHTQNITIPNIPYTNITYV